MQVGSVTVSVVGLPSAAMLMDEARRIAELSDFGQPGFQEGLARFLRGVEDETTLSEAATGRLHGQMRQRLVSRLEVEDWYRTHPELQQVAPAAVTSITGLPRTGTTALANMMSLDDGFRCLRAWEQVKPCPPPELGAEAADPRRLAAIAQSEWMVREHPKLAAMHLFDPDATEEDVELLGMDFAAQQLVLPIFGYHAWWRDHDMRETFAWHRRVVTLLQSRRGLETWLFKAPSHNFHLDAYFSAYPDTKVIMTHRDPAKVVPSAISIFAAMQPDGSAVDWSRFGRLHAEHLRIGAERAIAARARIGEQHFFDVHHHELVADPMGTLERIYAFLGRDLRPATRDKIQEWHGRNRSGAHGQHHYTAEQFGLTTSQLRSDFAFYIERFGVRVEG